MSSVAEESTTTRLRGVDGYRLVDCTVSVLPEGQEVHCGVFRDLGPKHRPDRPFRIVIHDCFRHRKMGRYYWQELNLQVQYALRYHSGPIDITVPLVRELVAGERI